MTENTIETIRHMLYPFGFLSAVPYSLRFLLQWIQSEREGRTVVPKIFWHFTILGNVLLILHCFLQSYFPLYFLLILQTVLAWRNLDLMGKKRGSFRGVIHGLLYAGLCATALFYLQSYILPTNSFSWIRTPQSDSVSPWLHVVGCVGIIAFSARFWIQWLDAEHARTSVLSTPFWWTSIFGAIVSGYYFVSLLDWVNAIGPICAILPYTRNLCLNGKSATNNSNCFGVVLIAGETSGDIIGGKIAHALSALFPHLRLEGVAGPCMRKEGVVAWLEAESFQVMGLFDVMKKFFFFYRSIRLIQKKILQSNPRVVIFIDQPSLSLSLAKRLKKQKCTGKLVQVVAPTVWAYREERVHSFATWFDLMLPLFRFECAYFEKAMNTVWVGHPIVQVLHTAKTPNKKKFLAIFPGSREGEIKHNLPLQLEAASKIEQLIPAIVIPTMASTSVKNYISSHFLSTFPHGQIFSFEDRYALMNQALAAITKSGTITLELALFHVPFVCCYQTNLLTRLWLQYICNIKTSLFALPNIIMKKKIFPERILPPVTAALIASDLIPYVSKKKQLPSSLEQDLAYQIDTKKPFGDAVVDAIRGFL